MPRTLRISASCAALLLTLVGGCSQRVIEITSEPPGALVWLNDVEVGRTPLQTRFQYYGEYDVRVVKEGFEPLRTSATAWTPIYERPPLDLATSPIPMTTRVRWHFALSPTLEQTQDAATFESGLNARARELRASLMEEQAQAAPPPPPTDAMGNPLPAKP